MPASKPCQIVLLPEKIDGLTSEQVEARFVADARRLVECELERRLLEQAWPK
jgi:hypothetical protein